MLNVILAGNFLYGKQLFTWLSLVVSLMASFVLSFFPLDVLDKIWDFASVFITLHSSQCSLHFDKHQKNTIHPFNIPCTLEEIRCDGVRADVCKALFLPKSIICHFQLMISLWFLLF